MKTMQTLMSEVHFDIDKQDSIYQVLKYNEKDGRSYVAEACNFVALDRL
jgi:hypothetical protein